MKKEIIKKLETILISDLKNFENYSLDEDKKAKGLAHIGKEVSILIADDKTKNDEKNRKIQQENEVKKQSFESDKLAFEKEKLEFERTMKKEQFNLDKSKFELEQSKLQNEYQLETRKREFETEKMERESKLAIIQIVVSVAGVASTFLLGLIGKILYAKLSFNAQIHEYKDYQIEPVSSKENRQNLLK